MTEKIEAPTLHFFRATPTDVLANSPLASSLQSLETTFLLLSLERYPSALVACVSAWESVIKASLKMQPNDGEPLAKLLAKVRDSAPSLMLFDREKIELVRKTRNHITHFGFSPYHDQECCRLLIETGLPFLTSLYSALYGFHLHWKDVRHGLTDFMQLTAQEAGNVGLLPDLSDQVGIVNAMYELNRTTEDFDVLLCFKVFNHYLRFMLRDSAASNADNLLAERALSSGLRFEIEHKEKQIISTQADCETWEFDCPICHSPSSIVAALDESNFRHEKVSLLWGVCVSCSLVMPRRAFHLADLVLRKQLTEQRDLILESYK
jgi:hypothetical protein